MSQIQTHKFRVVSSPAVMQNSDPPRQDDANAIRGMLFKHADFHEYLYVKKVRVLKVKGRIAEPSLRVSKVAFDLRAWPSGLEGSSG